MDEKEKQIRLTAGEMGQLWLQYLNDSSSICVLTFFLEKVEDIEIKPIIESALELSKLHIQKITAILTEEKNVVPYGFSIKEDVDLNAPRLYSDSFVLNFINQMSKVGLTTYAGSVGTSVRSDIRSYYMDCLTETMQLYDKSTELLLSKGLFIRSPSLPNLEKVEFVKKQWFMLDVFGEKRPLVAAEVDNLFANLQRNALGVATVTGFSQVAKDKDVKQFFLKGLEVGNKHIKLFRDKLEESKLPAPMAWDSEITNSTSHTFSDKLMMFFTSGLISLSVGYYGTAVSLSPRGDISAMYNRLSLEVQMYSEDGANIMIKNGWLEQPPMASDRDELIRKKNQL
ncbi:uncharacterized protein DUF3231 [Neobacillus bataviensis]|uniref:Uncharacterized protein DUF3231 n=1 Tax=Neobacillus bataviensis TaxID=220685 RepID=A0A561DF36_9BACI|nr:DUF3231 family protein [Neobacillus bataviensis]TWE01938.1 uncharacterized protein DUF3231 [Neobacillus bataviensis]